MFTTVTYYYKDAVVLLVHSLPQLEQKSLVILLDIFEDLVHKLLLFSQAKLAYFDHLTEACTVRSNIAEEPFPEPIVRGQSLECRPCERRFLIIVRIEATGENCIIQMVV